jgi:hypothetical protein
MWRMHGSSLRSTVICCLICCRRTRTARRCMA